MQEEYAVVKRQLAVVRKGAVRDTLLGLHEVSNDHEMAYRRQRNAETAHSPYRLLVAQQELLLRYHHQLPLRKATGRQAGFRKGQQFFAASHPPPATHAPACDYVSVKMQSLDERSLFSQTLLMSETTP